jgi:hypothetical protein
MSDETVHTFSYRIVDPREPALGLPLEAQAAGLSASYVPGELVVSFVDRDARVLSTSPSGITSIYPDLSAVLARRSLVSARALFGARSPVRNVYLLKFPENAPLDTIIEELKSLPFIRAVEKNWLIEPDFVPDDYYFNNDYNGDGQLDQWTFYKMQLNRAWNVTKGDSAVVVAVIDLGADWQHPDLDGTVWINSAEDINGNGLFDNYPSAQGGDIDGTDNDGNGYVDDVIGYDFWNGDPDPMPEPDSLSSGSHGTVVSSVIASETNNNYGVAGASWYSRIMVLRAGDEQHYVQISSVIEAINYAIDQGADIINMSFSFEYDVSQLHDAIAAADSAGIIMVGSAGDDQSEGAMYPGSYPEVIRVAAVDSSKVKTTRSNYGSDIAICAPSANDEFHGIVTCNYGSSAGYPGDQGSHIFKHFDVRTSGGAAEVTGVVALLKARYPQATKDFIISELTRGAEALNDPLYTQGKLGAGMVNAYRALTRWGTVSSDTTWSGVAYVSGDLTVASGKTLTIAAGTVIYIDGDDNEKAGGDPSKIEFDVYGTLNINGTAASPVVFQSWNGSGRTDWAGIRFMSGSSGGTLDHVIVKNAEIGIKHMVPVTITNATVSDCEAGIESHDDLTLSNSTVTQCTDFGVSVRKGTGTLDNVTVSNCDQYGIWTYPYYGTLASALSATGCHVHDNGVYGILVSGSASSIDLQQSTIEGNYFGVSISATTDLSLSGNTIRNNDTGLIVVSSMGTQQVGSVMNSTFDGNTTNGIWLSDTNVFVSADTLDNNGVGIFCTGATTAPLAISNTISNNSGGIKCDQGAQGFFANNVISGNNTGAGGLNGGNPDLGHHSGGSGTSPGNNSFRNNTGFDVSNFTAGLTIMAEDNYWGKRGPLPGKFYGSVDYDPWLSNDPNPSSPAEPPGDGGGRESSPDVYSLGENYPNPFNPTTSVSYEVPGPGGRVKIGVYDVRGRLVRMLVDEEKAPGSYTVRWNGRDEGGKVVASGVYIVRMRAGAFGASKKILLLK